MLIVCRVCGLELPEEHFAKRSKSKTGRQSYCKICKTETSKAFYKKNQEDIISAAKSWQQEHKEKANDNKRKWRESNNKNLPDLQKAAPAGDVLEEKAVS